MKTYVLVISILCMFLGMQAQVETEIQADLTTIGAVTIDGENNNAAGAIDINDEAGAVRIRMLGNVNASQQQSILSMFNADNNRTVAINAGISTGNQSGRIILYDEDGTQKITLNSSYDGTNKDARIITDEIEIKGGSDLAELFDITESAYTAEPGMLVSLNPMEPGKLMISTDSYDKKIAGVISGANGIKPGILMGQDETIAYGDDLVTLSGRTYVKANTSNGEIKVGDLITSSNVPGEAMKATKRKKSNGAIIGKAMTGLQDGHGFILVLVSLQ